MFAKGGYVLKKTTYVPNRDVKELMVVLKGSLTKLSGSDIIDGVYVKNSKSKSAPKENAKELFAQLEKQAKKDDYEIGFDESDIQKLFDAGFSVQDVKNIYFGYTPPIVNADTEFGDKTSGLDSFTADYQKRKIDLILQNSKDGFYEIGLKYPSFDWQSIIKKYSINAKPTIVTTDKSKTFRYKYEIYLGDGIAIGHAISTFRDNSWEDSEDKIGILNLKKPTEYQKERDYKAGFNGGYWGIVVRNKEILYDVIDTLLKQNDSYLKDLEVFWNGLGGIDSENVEKLKFAKGGKTADLDLKVGDKVSARFRYEYGEGLRVVSKMDMDNSESSSGEVVRFKDIDGTKVYYIKFNNGEELSFPDFALSNFIYKSSFAKGGMTEEDKLLKELRKLQRELNSPRLQKYTLGDTSDAEKARQEEREVKAKRFYEILEILRKTDSKKYAKGGQTTESAIKILMTEEPKVWDKFGFRSGSDIRASKEKTKKYAQELERVFFKEGIKKGTLTKQINEDLEDENYHLLNEFLVRNGYFKKDLNDSLLKTYENPIYVGAFADKESITISSSTPSAPKKTSSKKIQRKNISTKTTYVPRRDIKSVELKNSKSIPASDIVDGVYKKK
jgi:hypothetical protein